MDLLIILFLALLAWFWYDSVKARELAMKESFFSCQQRGLQFLDASVFLKKIRFRQTTNGFRFYRQYGFEFSKGGYHRYSGYCDLLQHNIQAIHLDIPPDIQADAEIINPKNQVFGFQPQKYLPLQNDKNKNA